MSCPFGDVWVPLKCPGCDETHLSNKMFMTLDSQGKRTKPMCLECIRLHGESAYQRALEIIEEKLEER